MRLAVKALLLLGLAATLAEMANASTYTCSSARNFLQFVQCKMRRVWLEVSEMKQTVQECCNKNDCIYDGQTLTHGSMLTAADGCNACVCNDGSVDCTNAPGCGQGGGLTYNYKDEIAQSYCASMAAAPDHISAVRRDCVGEPNQRCDDICGFNGTFANEIKASLPNATLTGFGCTGGLWVWFDHPMLAPNPGPGQTDPGLLNMVTISYGSSSCFNTGCGPNYCCCFAGDF